MRKHTERENDLLEAAKGTTKSALSLIPVLGQVIAGYDAYKQSSFDRNVKALINHLSEKVDNIEAFFNAEYFHTKEGQLFTSKIIDSALDSQLSDKQELFINALINAPTSQEGELQKLKFVDILRQLSRASLMVLAEMHNKFKKQVRGLGRSPDPMQPYPLVDPTSIAQDLSSKYEPYLVTSSISEMESQGLFSTTGEWVNDNSGRYTPGGGFATEMCYTDFTARFVEFIIASKDI